MSTIPPPGPGAGPQPPEEGVEPWPDDDDPVFDVPDDEVWPEPGNDPGYDGPGYLSAFVTFAPSLFDSGSCCKLHRCFVGQHPNHGTIIPYQLHLHFWQSHSRHLGRRWRRQH